MLNVLCATSILRLGLSVYLQTPLGGHTYRRLEILRPLLRAEDGKPLLGSRVAVV